MKLYIILFLLLIPGVIAIDSLESNTSQLTNILGNNLEELKIKYNQNIGEAPWIARTVIGNERINTYLTLNSGNKIILGGITNKARILQAQIGEISNPTLNIYITEKTIQRLTKKEVTLEQAIKSKEITYKSLRIRTSIKAWFAKRFLKYF